MAAKKNAKTRRSPADIKKAWQNFQPALAEHRKEHERQGQTFKSVTREEFEAKMKRANSPMILSEGWSNSAPPGGTINYSVGIGNPDPIEWFTLAVSVSIGNRNPIASNDEFLTAFDTRFPTYAKPATSGFSLAPGAFTTQSFSDYDSGRCRKDRLLRQLRIAEHFISGRRPVSGPRVFLL